MIYWSYSYIMFLKQPYTINRASTLKFSKEAQAKKVSVNSHRPQGWLAMDRSTAILVIP